MKRRHQLGRSIRRLLILILLIAVSVGAFYGFRGYRMYRGAIEQMSVEERVEQIRAREHFTRYSELTDFYIFAVISVEDHMFKD
ncbi:MAG: glycosyl transferase, partial [Lachnospiraceae bacterium]|nr:glycosyl transferase [Lachnospiraceae bacterium]